ncbi:alpha/beta hydrolase [Candidatus Gottesmanbacteria bacterium]|nr:alpha/beta hydrolase [Candidatus Gottesmanbacteria bacterium]
MKKIILILSSVGFLILTAIFLYVWYQFHSSIAFHVSAGDQTPERFNLVVEPHQLTSADGIKLSSWYIPTKDPKAVVILVHGYSTSNGGKSEMLEESQFIHEAGYSTLLIDLRSFGDSEGNKISLGTKEWQDVAAVYDFAKSRPENKNKKVGLLGDSMGAATAIITAGKTGKADFVIAQVPFSSYKTLLREQIKREKYPSILVPVLLPFLRLATALDLGLNYESYSPDKLVNNIKVPIFIIGAQNDEWVGSGAGKILFHLANQPKEFWQANTTHDVFTDNPEELKRRILEFLAKYINSNS